KPPGSDPAKPPAGRPEVRRPGARRDHVAEASRHSPRRASAGVSRLPGGPGGRGRTPWDRPRELLAAAQRRVEPGPGRLAGARVDAGDAPGVVRGFRSDPSG